MGFENWKKKKKRLRQCCKDSNNVWLQRKVCIHTWLVCNGTTLPDIPISPKLPVGSDITWTQSFSIVSCVQVIVWVGPTRTRQWGGHSNIVELHIRVNKNIEKGSDFGHWRRLGGRFLTILTKRVLYWSKMNTNLHLGSYFGRLQFSRYACLELRVPIM